MKFFYHIFFYDLNFNIIYSFKIWEEVQGLQVSAAPPTKTPPTRTRPLDHRTRATFPVSSSTILLTKGSIFKETPDMLHSIGLQRRDEAGEGEERPADIFPVVFWLPDRSKLHVDCDRPPPWFGHQYDWEKYFPPSAHPQKGRVARWRRRNGRSIYFIIQ